MTIKNGGKMWKKEEWKSEDFQEYLLPDLC